MGKSFNIVKKPIKVFDLYEWWQFLDDINKMVKWPSQIEKKNYNTPLKDFEKQHRQWKCTSHAHGIEVY